jgi:hypothetical protein
MSSVFLHVPILASVPILPLVFLYVPILVSFLYVPILVSPFWPEEDRTGRSPRPGTPEPAPDADNTNTRGQTCPAP